MENYGDIPDITINIHICQWLLLLTYPLYTLDSALQKNFHSAFLLPKAGQILIGLAGNEPAGGNNLFEYQTKAVRDGDE